MLWNATCFQLFMTRFLHRPLPCHCLGHNRSNKNNCNVFVYATKAPHYPSIGPNQKMKGSLNSLNTNLTEAQHPARHFDPDTT